MNKAILTLLLGVFACIACSSGRSGYVECYLKARRPTYSEIKVVRRIDASKLSDLQASAVHYVRAMTSKSSEPHVTRLVRRAVRRSLGVDEAQALPYALGAIYEHRRDSASFRYIMELDLDASTAEMLGFVRVAILTKEPRKVARHLLKKHGSLLATLKWISDNPTSNFMWGLNTEIESNPWIFSELRKRFEVYDDDEAQVVNWLLTGRGFGSKNK